MSTNRLQVTIIADVQQPARAMSQLEVEARKAAATIGGVGQAVTNASNTMRSATNAMVNDLNQVSGAANRAAASVGALEDRIARARRVQAIQGAPSPFPAATGGGFTSGPSLGSTFGSLASSYGPTAGIAAAYAGSQFIGDSISSYQAQVRGGFSADALGLAGGSLSQVNAKLGLGTDEVYGAYAAALGKTSSALSDAEKKQAQLNEAMRQGNAVAAEAIRYQETYAGRYDALIKRWEELKARIGGGVLQGTFEPGSAAGVGLAVLTAGQSGLISQAANYLAPPGSTQSGYGALASRFGALAGGASNLFGAGLDYLRGGFAERAEAQAAARRAEGEAWIQSTYAASDLYYQNQAAYQARLPQLQAQLAAQGQSYIGGINNLVNLQNRRAALRQSIDYYGFGTDYGRVSYGESPQDTLARVFDAAGGIGEAIAGVPGANADKLARQYLLAATAGTNPASFTDSQRATLDAALEAAIKDQIADSAESRKVQQQIANDIRELRKKLVGNGPEDADLPKPATVFVVNETNFSIARFSDSPANKPQLFANGDSLSSDDF